MIESFDELTDELSFGIDPKDAFNDAIKLFSSEVQ